MMKRRRRVRYSGLIVAAMVGVVAALNYMRPLPLTAANAAGLTSSIGIPTLAWPVGGESAVGASGYGVLATNGPQTPMATASLAKVITALAVLKAKPLAPGEQGPSITITNADVALYNKYVAEQGSVARVAAGEQLSEYQALQAMLLPSANNVADTLAIWAFGSLPAYQTYASQMVAQMGLKHTVVGSDASGFLPDTEGSAADMVLLGEAALKNPVIAQIAAQKSATLPVAGTVPNANGLVGVDGIVGLKVGNNDQDRGAFLFAAKRTVGAQTVTIVGVVMGQGNLRAAMEASHTLLNSAVKGFATVTPITAGQTLATYTTPWGKTSTAVAAHSLSIAVWQGGASMPHLNLKTNGLFGNSNAVGTATITAGDNSVSTDVLLTHTISPPSFWWRLLRF